MPMRFFVVFAFLVGTMVWVTLNPEIAVELGLASVRTGCP